MKLEFTGIEATLNDIRKHVNKLEQRAIEHMKKAARIVQQEFNARTPVWSGETVRNYSWGVGKANRGGTKGAIGTGDPGDTKNMSLGEEPRRGANEAAVMAEIGGLNMKKLDDLVLTNNVGGAKWDLIDNGNAPYPGKGRNFPGGVSKLAIMSSKRILENFK